MYCYADQLREGAILQGFDICIVGAGAAGIAMAQRLANSSLKVILLVSGGPADRSVPAEARQSLYEGTVGEFLAKVDPNFPQRSRLNMYGGTTNHFGFWARPLDAADMMARPGYRDVGWLISPEELRPYYVAAHEFGHFGPFNYDDMSFWRRVLYARPFDALPGDKLEGAIMRAQYEANLHDFQVQFRDELAQAENITVLFNAHLLTIETDENQRQVSALKCSTIVTSAEGGAAAGGRFQVRPRCAVLACGGIENARLLQLSGDLGNNKRDMLGRGFMVHPLLTNAARVVFDEPVASDIRNFFREQQIRLKAPDNEAGEYRHMVEPLVNPELVFEYLMFNAWGVLAPKHQTLLAERIGNFRIILYFRGEGKSAIVNLNWEQRPNENSRIRLDRERVDPIFGQRLAHIDWRLDDIDKHSAMRALELTLAYLRDRGAVREEMITDVSGGAESWTFPPDEGALETGDHHMGALRMSASPEDGLVDVHSRLHSVDNLYIAGSAVFPSGGYANPTLTIVALALRLADHLKRVLG
ncbi:MAG: GMC oxidoreductase [Chloroflexota bacterium]|nr:GMC oxidoreductase [Chloroflexota bacterium]MDE2908977.1 GMC oxidoreductase [Chloroflexota bacterium]